jgi:hypothetical protein
VLIVSRPLRHIPTASAGTTRTIAKKNPEAVKQAAQPALEAAEKWERVLSLEPRSEAALEREKQPGKSLAELKSQSETLTGFLRSAANVALSLTK